MASVGSVKPLVVIYGPTGSGKTSLAIRLAQEFDGEVISADSRAIYKGLDIATAKPTLSERRGIPHWGIDLVSPGEVFSAANFKIYAAQKIREIRQRGKVPILVGGTGLYIDSVIFDYNFPEPLSKEARDNLEAMDIEQLYSHCRQNNIALPENYKNKRYVINTILRQGLRSTRRDTPIENCIIVGIATDKNELRTRLEERARQIVGKEVLNEARQISKEFGWQSEAMTANIYPLIRKYNEGLIGLDELRAAFLQSDWKLAKRQMTWLRRNEYIKWATLADAYTYCARALVNMNNS